MTTAQNVFDLALGLMDEMAGADSIDTREYKQRALPVLSVLRGELYVYSDTYTRTGTCRPICPEILDFESPLGLDDFLAQSILPYGLAAHLLLDENPGAAGFFQQRYQELIIRYAAALAAEPEAIADLYGGIRASGGKAAQNG